MNNTSKQKLESIQSVVDSWSIEEISSGAAMHAVQILLINPAKPSKEDIEYGKKLACKLLNNARK